MVSSVRVRSHYIFLFFLAVVSLLYNFLLIDFKEIDANGDNLYHAYMAKTIFTSHPFHIPLINYFFRDDSIPHPGYDFPPLFSVLVGVIYKIFGDNYYYGIYFNSVIASLTAVPIFLIGRRFSGSLAGFSAALFLMLNIYWLFSITKGLLEPLFVFFMMWSIYFLFLYEDKPNRCFLIISGVLVGLSYLSRYNGLVCLFGTVIYLLTKSDKKIHERLKDAVLLIIIFLITISPWLIRNYIEFKDPFMYVGKYFMWLDLGVPGHSILKETPSFQQYFKTHTFGDFMLRLWNSIKTSFPDLNYSSNYFLFMIMHQIVFAARQVIDRRYLLFYLIAGIGYFFVMLHPFALDPRHFLPFYPLLYLAGFIYLFSLSSKFKRKRSILNFIMVSSASVILLLMSGSVYSQYKKDFKMLYSSYSFSKTAAELGRWFREDTSPDDVVMMEYAMIPVYFANRAAVTAPASATQEDIDRIVKRYKVAYFVDLLYSGKRPLGFREIKSFYMSNQIIKVYHREYS